MNLIYHILHFIRGSVTYAEILKIELSERQVTVIHFALQAIEQVHKKRPTFLTKKGITQTELKELLATLEDSGDLVENKKKVTRGPYG